MYKILLSRAASRFFEEAEPPLRRRLLRCFENLASEPRHHPNIKALRGELGGYHRYRIGDYRVVYQIKSSEQVVVIAVIAHRRDAYH